MQITKNLPMEQYLKLEAVSASVLKLVVEDCPAAAWHESYLNPNREADDTKESDAGTIAHSILLEGHAGNVCVIDPNDHPAEKTGSIPDGWTNKSIRGARDAARAAGQIPVLKGDFASIEAMVGSARRYIESLRHSEPAIFDAFLPGHGESELTIQWDHDGTACRIRPDRISADRKLIVDVKTTTGSANPEAWSRTQMVAMGGYTSAAFYRMGCMEAFETSPEYVFLVVEQNPPYLCSLVGCDPHAMELGREKALAGLQLWARCMAAKQWPAYPNKIVYPELPPYVESNWVEKQTGEAGLAHYDVLFGEGSMTTEIKEYSETEAALAKLSQDYKGVVYDVTTAEGMGAARKGRAELRTYRTSLEKMRVHLKGDVLKRGRLIDGEANRITAELEALENPIDEQIKKEEKRIEDIRLAKVREEEARKAAEEQARKEAEEARMAAERAEIAKRQAELDRAERERREADERARLKLEEEAREARRKIEEEERHARMGREQADREARLAREAEEARIAKDRREEEARLAAERAKLEAERRAVEEAQRKEREAEEARQREIRRKENEKLDGRTMLITFRDQYGKVEEFAPVVKAINAYLKALKEAA